MSAPIPVKTLLVDIFAFPVCARAVARGRLQVTQRKPLGKRSSSSLLATLARTAEPLGRPGKPSSAAPSACKEGPPSPGGERKRKRAFTPAIFRRRFTRDKLLIPPTYIPPPGCRSLRSCNCAIRSLRAPADHESTVPSHRVSTDAAFPAADVRLTLLEATIANEPSGWRRVPMASFSADRTGKAR
jgi:hypothetical protein